MTFERVRVFNIVTLSVVWEIYDDEQASPAVIPYTGYLPPNCVCETINVEVKFVEFLAFSGTLPSPSALPGPEPPASPQPFEL